MKSLTHRQERFCHAFVHWANGAEAAREAGYTVRSARKQASVMLQTVRIRARIHEIQTKLAEDAGTDMAALIGKLEIIYRRAIGDHHFYAAARAIEAKALDYLMPDVERIGGVTGWMRTAKIAEAAGPE